VRSSFKKEQSCRNSKKCLLKATLRLKSSKCLTLQVKTDPEWTWLRPTMASHTRSTALIFQWIPKHASLPCQRARKFPWVSTFCKGTMLSWKTWSNHFFSITSATFVSTFQSRFVKKQPYPKILHQTRERWELFKVTRLATQMKDSRG